MEIVNLIVGELEVNCYLVGDREKNEWLVIDPGGDEEKILEAIEKRKADIKFIINTHGHPDHTGANNIIKKETGAPLYIHKEDASLLSKPDHFLKEGDILPLGDTSLKVIHTPGHTRGGICLLAPEALFSGDTLFAGSIGRTDLPGGSLPVLLRSIRDKLFSLPENTKVYPGHGPQTTIGEEKRSNPFLI